MNTSSLAILFILPLVLPIGAEGVGKIDSGLLTTNSRAVAPNEDGMSAQGTLVIAGGGGLPAELTAEFVRLAGGEASNIVVIPTASKDADRPDDGRTEKAWMERGAGTVTVLHTRSKKEANGVAFIAPLKNATGVWFGGGSQSRITDAYLGTKVEKELRALLERGGVIGGSSAGAAIMTKVMITGGNPKAKTGPGFGFLQGVVVDQHFLRRNRVNRLLGVLNSNRGLVGIGIDEGTGIVCAGDEIRAIGRSYVSIFVPQPRGQPMRVEILNDGENANLKELIQDAARR